MEDRDLVLSRVKELSRKASVQNYIANTDFLSLSEQGFFFSYLKEQNIDPALGRINGCSFSLFGGSEDADRKVVFFLPQGKEEELPSAKENAIVLLHILPRSPRFADVLSHRDYLGSLMSLGYERKEFGDILVDENGGYVFVLKKVASFVQEEISKIKHTPVYGEILDVSACPLHPRFSMETYSVSSPRLDAVIGEVFRLSRRDAQEAIGHEEVFLDGACCKNSAKTLKGGERISMAGKGKFLYDGEEKKSRKGRSFIQIRRYL